MRGTPARSSGLNDSMRETLRQFQAGHAVKDIARQRGFVPGTIYGHLAGAIEAGERLELDRFFSAEELEKVAPLFDKTGLSNLGDSFETLGGQIEYVRLRIYRAIRKQKVEVGS